MKNKLGFLGLAGLLGIAGFFADNWVYFFFFAFFYFFRYFFVIPDELFRENVRRAATPAFFLSMALYVLTVASTAFHAGVLIFTIGLVASSTIPFLVFTLRLAWTEYKESRGE